MKNRNIDYENLKLLNSPYIQEYLAACNGVLNSGWFVLGENVSFFEREFADYCGTEFCVGVASGLDALILSLKVLNLPAKSEVLVPSNTYIATILAILHCDLIPVLVEPDIFTYNISVKNAERKLTKHTTAIIVVHLYGKVVDIENITEFARNANLKIIEDGAQSHGASFRGQKSGSLGDIAAHSFYPTKNLGALGDAGAITFSNMEYYDNLLRLRNYGSRIKYHNDVIGYNSRLDELQASFLRVKLRDLDRINEHKRSLAGLYTDGLSEKVVKPLPQNEYFDVFHIYQIRHERRDDLRNYLLDNGVKTEVHYPIAPHKQNCFKGMFSNSYPISELIHNTVLSLPCSVIHSEGDVKYVIDLVNDFVD